MLTRKMLLSINMSRRHTHMNLVIYIETLFSESLFLYSYIYFFFFCQHNLNKHKTIN